MTDKLTRSAKVQEEIRDLLRSRSSLLWVTTREEARAEQYICQAAIDAKFVPRTWDCGDGVCDLSGQRITNMGVGGDIDATLATIKARAETGADRGVWILRDAVPWITGAIGLQSGRRLRNLAKYLQTLPQDQAQAIVVLTASGQIPDELAGHAVAIDWPLPDRDEIAAILDATVAAQPERDRAGNPLRARLLNGNRDEVIDAAVGLMGSEAENCFAKSLVQHGRFDIPAISAEKKRVISRDKVLEWVDPLKGGLNSVGGLDGVKEWLAVRKNAYSKAARSYGLPAPKGMLLVGIAGCGKSLTAKAVATAWGEPLLRFDPGALKSKFVGESEANFRKAQKTIEALGRCVVWIDEIEKALQGSTSGSADGGVSSDQLASLLSWMQDRKSEAFIIATSNDVSALPPELLRKGRFDETFFVDLPNPTERLEIVKAALREYRRAAIVDELDLAAVVPVTANFTGAEIASLVPDALYKAFADGQRQITTLDLIEAAGTVVPMSKTASEKIANLRKWAIAEGRARPATKAETKAAPKIRALDL